MIGVLLSGGVDSTYALQTALQSGEDVVTCHVQVSEPHLVPQRHAVDKIVQAYRGLGHQFAHEVISFGTKMTWPHDPYFFKAVAMITIAHNYPINRVYMGDCIDDCEDEIRTGEDQLYRYHVRLGTIMALFHYTVIDPRATTSPPAEYEIGQGQRKRDLFLALPEHIRPLCWGCTKPVRVSPSRYIPCGQCAKCEVYNEFACPSG